MKGSKNVFLASLGLGVLFFIVVSYPFLIIGSVGLFTPSQFRETYLGALADKHSLICKTTDPKIVVVGGSSVPFGMRSDLLESHFPDYKVVDYGLYGTVGTKAMLDLSVSHITKGDLVIISPEVSSQANSLYFSPETMLKCLDSDWSMWKEIPNDNQKQMMGYFAPYVNDKMDYSSGKKTIGHVGVYQRVNLNRFGDIEYLKRDASGNIIYDDQGKAISLRTANQMASLYDPNTPIAYSTADIALDFVCYLNNYAASVKSKGANIVYSFGPANALAVVSKQNEMLSYYEFLRSHLNFDVISNPMDYVFDARYFYDNNYHLNDAGAIYRTRNLILDLWRYYGETKTMDIAIPAAPEPAIIDDGDQPDSATAGYFDYEEILTESGTLRGYALSDVKSSHLNDESLVVPEFLNKHRILTIKADAFSHTVNLKAVRLSKTLTLISDGAFNGCSKLTAIYVPDVPAEQISVSWSKGLLAGADNAYLYIPSARVGEYANDYNWSNYSGRFKAYDL